MKIVGGMLTIVAGLSAFMYVFMLFTTPPELAATPAVIRTVTESMDQYQKEERQRETNARRDLSLTPLKVTPSSFGVDVMWEIDNRSNEQYRTVSWDCTAFFNSAPVATTIVMRHHNPANHKSYVDTGFSFHEFDRSAKNIDPSAFRFECQLMTGLTYPDRSK